ncbi:hypothetical protein HOC01_04400 [archaeon]|jgi:hypothetical protein|nr:hypothetical protein [archaeon]MBT6698347.1 hypothetical protein [archaeon]
MATAKSRKNIKNQKSYIEEIAVIKERMRKREQKIFELLGRLRSDK